MHKRFQGWWLNEAGTGGMALGLTLLLIVAGCSNSDSPSPDAARSGNEGTSSSVSSSIDQSSTAQSSTGGQGTSVPPNDEAKFNLIASPDNGSCNYIPHGHLSGADQLTVRFYFLMILGNPDDIGHLLNVRGTSDSGITTSYFTSPSNDALSNAQFALDAGDFGRSHAITIMVDAHDEVVETDETDNSIRVDVSLPQRPNSVIDPLPCSITSS
jgi:hypothetical protein